MPDDRIATVRPVDEREAAGVDTLVPGEKLDRLQRIRHFRADRHGLEIAAAVAHPMTR